MSEQEFWHLTFREAHLLHAAYWQRQKRATVPMAMLIQVLLNVNRDTEQRREPFGVDEVLEWLGFPDEERPAPPARRTIEEMDRQISMMHAMYTAIHASNGEVSG